MDYPKEWSATRVRAAYMKWYHGDEDAVQDALVGYTIAKNKGFHGKQALVAGRWHQTNVWKKYKKPKRFTGHSLQFLESKAAAPMIDSNVDYERMCAALETAWDKLIPATKAVAILAWRDGLTDLEIGRLNGYSRQCSWQHVDRARKALRTALTEFLNG